MNGVPLKKTGVSTGERWLLVLTGLLLLLAYQQLLLDDTRSEFMPSVVEAFFYASGVPTRLIYALAAGLMLFRWRDVTHAYQGNGEPFIGALFLLPGTGLYLWGHFTGAADLVHVSLVLLLFGVLRTVSGRQLTHTVLPLLLMLVIATPIPAVVLNQIVLPLQLQGAQQSAWLLNAIGRPSLAVGDMISTASGATRFAETCTSIGFTLWLTIFALAYVYLFRVKGWHAVLLVLSAPLIAFAVNILRAFSLVMNPALEVLTIHTLQGVVFFILGFALLYAVDTVLLRVMPGRQSGAAHSKDAGNKRTVSTGRQRSLMVLCLLLLLLSAASFLLPVWPVPTADRTPAVALAEHYGDWQHAGTSRVYYTFLGSVRYSSTAYFDYRQGGDVVVLFVGTDDRLRRNRSLVSDKNAYPDVIGLEQSRRRLDLGEPVGEVTAVVTDVGTRRLLSYYWYDGVDGVAREVLYATLALDQSPLRRDKRARVTRLTTGVDLLPGGMARAAARLRQFLDDYSESTANAPDQK